VDGMLVPLFERPYWYGESYFDRKSNYSMNVQVCYFEHVSAIYVYKLPPDCDASKYAHR
jgi:hypothetical protein